MRRVGGLWPRIIDFSNLCAAARRAARGKRDLAAVARFLLDLESESLRLQRELEDESWSPGTPACFTIIDPKERLITAAPFRDRVVHHALLAPLEPIFDRRMVYESFACRKGKGTHAALRHVRRELRRHRWFLKLDIQKYFDSIRHEVALAAVARSIKDRKALRLWERIIRVGGLGKEVGLPIGALTSQWLANLVLDPIDHFIKERLRIPGYVRYMDDFGLFSGDKAQLAAAHDTLAAELAARGLVFKERVTKLAPSAEGLPFLGWHLYRGTERIRGENARRSRARLRRRGRDLAAGRIGEREYADAARSVMAHLARGDTRSLRRAWLEDLVNARREP